MKTNRLLRAACIMLLLALGGKLAYNHNLWNIRGVEPSELYLRYEHVDGIKASFIKDYHVNDTLTLDVTLLQATDSAGWQQLLTYYDIPAELIESTEQFVAAGHNPLTIIGSKATDTQTPVASFRDKYICTFHTRNRRQKEQIKMEIFRLITNTIKENQKLTPNEEKN